MFHYPFLLFQSFSLTFILYLLFHSCRLSHLLSLFILLLSAYLKISSSGEEDI